MVLENVNFSYRVEVFYTSKKVYQVSVNDLSDGKLCYFNFKKVKDVFDVLANLPGHIDLVMIGC